MILRLIGMFLVSCSFIIFRAEARIVILNSENAADILYIPYEKSVDPYKEFSKYQGKFTKEEIVTKIDKYLIRVSDPAAQDYYSITDNSLNISVLVKFSSFSLVLIVK